MNLQINDIYKKYNMIQLNKDYIGEQNEFSFK